MPKLSSSKVVWPKLACPAPSKVLREEFLEPLGITPQRLAHEIGVPRRQIGEIVAGKRSISADVGLRLSRFFGMSEAFFIVLQATYDRETARAALADRLEAIRPWRSSAPLRA